MSDGEIHVPDWLTDVTPFTDVSQYGDRHVDAALASETLGLAELAALLSPAATVRLEQLAARAQALTRRHFGRTMALYVPLYLSNFCSGGCVYCGFAADRPMKRDRLEFDQVERELDAIASMGFEEVLLLTGERTPHADYEYLRRCVELAAKRFHLVTIEVFPMSMEEYRGLVDVGCTGVTIYQETYHPATYDVMHRWGPKKDMRYRLDAPDRAFEAGVRTMGLGALLGISEPVYDVLSLYLHARYLTKRWWQAGVSVSFPRIRPQVGGYQAAYPVDERFLMQIVCALRIALPDVPMTLSTREPAWFRDGIAGVGVNRMSIASRTTVGGYDPHQQSDYGQFQVNDDRAIEPFCEMLRSKGLEPIFKNWDAVYREGVHTL
jgi:2-iminoacetate synthase